MHDIGLFSFGLAVAALTFSAAFIALIASDHPERQHTGDGDSRKYLGQPSAAGVRTTSIPALGKRSRCPSGMILRRAFRTSAKSVRPTPGLWR